MSQILYYIPGQKGKTDQEVLKKRLPELGLGHIADDVAETMPVRNGPCKNKAGIVFTLKQTLAGAGATPSKTGYFKTRQLWIPCNNGAYCIGVDTDQPLPQPIDMVRSKPLDGHNVNLGTGADKYSIPYSRNFRHLDILPKAMGVGPDGAFRQGEVLEKYKSFSAKCEKLFVPFWEAQEAYEATKKENINFTHAEGWELIIDALALNYQLGVFEVSLLELVNDHNFPICLKALCDWPSFVIFMKNELEECKKKGLLTGNGIDSNSGASVS